MFESKINRGRANGYAPLDGDGKVSLSHLPDVVGVAGTSGTSGVNGSQGLNGTPGTSGTSGESGTSGTSGISGTSGESGTSGVDGTSGESGTSGVDGTSGTSILLDSTLTFDNNIIEGNVFGTTGTQITISQGYNGNVNINSNTIQVTDNEETSAVQVGWIIRFYNGTTQTVLANSVPSGQIYRNIQFEDVVNLIPAYPLTIESPDYQLGSDAFVELKVGEHSIVLGDDGILKLNNGLGEIYADDENYSVRIGTSAENVAPNAQIILGIGNETLKIKAGPPLREWTFGENGNFNLTGSINGARNLATTGSNTFIGNQTISGSLMISGSGSLNGSNIVSSNTVMKMETISSASYAALNPPVSGTLYIII
jgi:hypothetical protein